MSRVQARAGKPITDVVFTATDLDRIRAILVVCGQLAGLNRDRVVLWLSAVHEVAVNAVQHAGGRGRLRVYQSTTQRLVAQIDDRGPGVDHAFLLRHNSYGWRLVEAFCDLVTVRGSHTGTTVRLEITSRTTPATDTQRCRATVRRADRPAPHRQLRRWQTSREARREQILRRTHPTADLDTA